MKPSIRIFARREDPADRGAEGAVRPPLGARVRSSRILIAALLCLSGALPAGAQDAPAALDANGFHPVTADPPLVADCEPGRYGGTVSWCEIGEVSTFNPLVYGDATMGELREMVFDALVNYDQERWEFEPALAHSWERSEDGLVWTFHLRKGVKWSDGKPFSADDVLFSYAACFHEKIANSNRDQFKVGDAPFPTVEKVDDYTVRLKCSVVNALMIVAVGNVSICPAHLWAKEIEGDNPTYAQAMNARCDPATVVGTGPFRIARYESGQAIVYERNPWSWRVDKAGKPLPYADRAVVLFAKDQNTRTLKFLNKDFDILSDLPVPDYDQYRARAKEGWFTLKKAGLSLNTTWVTFNQHPGKDASGTPFVEPHKLAWFRDVRFRRAMSHASDREGLVKLLLEGKGEPVYDQTSPGNKTWFAEQTRYPYDPAKASALLDEMGLAARDEAGVRKDAAGHRVEFELMTNVENNLRTKAIDQLKQDWAKVGVSVITRPVNFNELVTQLQDGHRWDGILLGWGSGVPPDPLNGKNITLSSGRLHAWYPQQAKPDAPWEAEVDDIVTKMSSIFDEKDRVPHWHRVLQLNAENQPQLFLYAQNAYAVWKSRVKNVRCSLLRPMATWNAEELWLEDGK